MRNRFLPGLVGIALVIVLVLSLITSKITITSNGLLSISLGNAVVEAQEQQEPGSPAYQVLSPTNGGSETGLAVYPPKLQVGGSKDNWLAVQSPEGLEVPVGTMILDGDGYPVGVNTSIGSIYIRPSTNYLIISPYVLNAKCSKDIEVTSYSLYGNVTAYDKNFGKNITSPLTAKFRSYVYGSGSDTYQLEDCPQRWDARNLTVVSVTIYAIVRGTVTKSSAATRINTDTKKFNGSTVILGVSNDTLISTTYTINPNTSLNWTWVELDNLEAGVVLKDSAECSYVYVLVKTEVHSQTFFPITPVDKTPGSTGSWVDVDCSSQIAEGATGVLIHMANSGGDWQYGLRKNGSTDDRYAYLVTSHHCWAAIGVDASRIFEAKISNTGVKIWVIGYTMSGVTFHTNGYDKTPSSTYSWVDVNCSAQAPSATGLILNNYPGSSAADIGWRKNGSTTNLHYNVAHYGAFGTIVGCDNSRIVEGYSTSTTNLKSYLVGYITAGVTWYTNAVDTSLGGTGTWTDLAALPSNTGMGFYLIINWYPSSWNFGLRKNGSSEDIYLYIRSYGISWAFVGCDENWLIEGKIQYTDTDFYLLGYAEVTSISAPTVTTQDATDILSTSCTGNGNITATGGENATTRGFCYMVGQAGDPTTANSTAYDTGSYGTGTYTKSITGLTPSTYYRVRAYANNTAGTGYGTTVNVTTLPGDPASLTDVAHNGTSINLTWTNGTGSNSTLIMYKTGSYPSSKTDGTQAYNSTGASVNVTSLNYSVLYYFRAWALNTTTSLWSSGTSDRAAYTDPNAPTSFVVANRTSISIGLNWTNGTGSDQTRIQYRTDQYPTTYSDGTQAYNSTGTSTNVTSLSAGQIYYFRAWSYNTTSGYYDSYAQLTDYTLPGDPSALNASNPTISTIDVSWTKGTGGDKTMVRYAKVDYPTYSTGTQLYFDTGTSQQATSLDASTTYYFRCWSYDSDSSYNSSGYSSDTDTTLASTPDITNIPGSYDFGTLQVNTTSNTTINYFTLNNTGNCPVNVTIQGTNMTGTSTYEYFNTGDDGHWLIYGNDWLGQTFKPSVSHTITSVKLLVFRSGSPGTITVSIRATDGDGHPTGGDLCSGTTNGDTLPDSSPYEWREITFGDSYNLTANTKYAIVVRAVSNGLQWRSDTSSPTYTNGCIKDSTNGGSSWASLTYGDFMFEEYGEYIWYLSGTATPDENIYGLYAGLDDVGDAFDIVVNLTANTFVAGLPVTTTQAWGLKFYMPVSVTGYTGQAMNGQITLVASAA